MGLTEKKVQRAKEPGRYHDAHGLYLNITATGSKSWLFRYERGGKESWMGLGALHAVSLSDARTAAQDARRLLHNGIDPLDRRRTKRASTAVTKAKSITFRECAVSYHAAHEGKWSSAKHARQFFSTLEAHAFPTLGKLPVAQIDTALVLRCIEPQWKKKPETMRRTLSRIAAVLAWAAARGYRRSDNPALWHNNLDKVLPARSQIAKVRHHPALPFDELPAFMTALADREGVAARALAFTILTACRTSEATNATWAEIDVAEKVWTVPGERTKSRRPHRVPLSVTVMELLEALPRERGNPHVFIGGRKGEPLSNMAMLTLLRRMGRDDITVHGFRSTFRDWCAERTNFPREVAEAALAHVVDDKVEAAYRRGDLFAKRARLMTAWATFALSPPKAGAVVPIRRTAGG